MSIREMTTADAAQVSDICRRAFHHSVANATSPEGLTTFTRISTPEFLKQVIQDPHNTGLVFEESQVIKGILLLKRGEHLSLLFIEPAYQKQGIGRQLIEAMLPHCTQASVTVRASLSSVPAYQKYGFVCTAAQGCEEGLDYQPMERLI